MSSSAVDPLQTWAIHLADPNTQLDVLEERIAAREAKSA
jgi:hypothetical protein